MRDGILVLLLLSCHVGQEGTGASATSTGGDTTSTGGDPTLCADMPEGTPGFVICGARDGDLAEGKPGGDVNGDGLADIIVETDNGPAYVVFGKTDTAPVRLAELAGSAGIVLDASDLSDEVGGDLVVKPASDVNGDGFDDILVMAGYWGFGGVFSEAVPDVFVVFGGPDIHSLDLAALAPAEGRRLYDAQESVGWMEPLGDVNADGFADLAVIEGHCCILHIAVIYGSADPQEVTEVDLRADQGGFIIDGFPSTDVAAADVNGDGFGDLVVEASESGLEGLGHEVFAHVIFGGPELHGLDFLLDQAPPTFDGFTISRGVSDFEVAAGADVNGDGLDDIVLVSEYSGETAVVFGKKSTTPVALPDDLAGGAGFAITVDVTAGVEPRLAPDLNGDGLADIALVADDAEWNERPNQRVYVIYGKSDTDPVVADDPGAGFAFDARPPGQTSGKFGGWAQIDGKDGLDVVVSVHGSPYDDVPEPSHVFVYFDKTPG